MAKDEMQAVLANWIGQALRPTGRLPEGTDPVAWVASHFAAWCRERAEDSLLDAERATSAVGNELQGLGGWESFGEALHELCHVRDALADLRSILGLAMENQPSDKPQDSDGSGKREG
jgi:hypothetical protein